MARIGAKSAAVLGQADEDVAADAFASDRLQAELALVEIRRPSGGRTAAAVELVGPLVIGADELCRRAFLGVADAAAAMAAGIVEGVDLALLVAHQHDRIVADLHGDVAARLRQLAIMADEQPVAIPDQLHVELEDNPDRCRRAARAKSLALRPSRASACRCAHPCPVLVVSKD
jgi:hypothetical protein